MSLAWAAGAVRARHASAARARVRVRVMNRSNTPAHYFDSDGSISWMSSLWSDEAEEIIGSDQVVAFAHVTPMRGVVVTPLTNTGLRDRVAETAEPVSSSV